MSKKIRIHPIFFWVACALWALFIFVNSMQTGNESEQMSGSVTEAINDDGGYDGIGRLVYENTWGNTASYTDAYAYDTFGNRISKMNMEDFKLKCPHLVK